MMKYFMGKYSLNSGIYFLPMWFEINESRNTYYMRMYPLYVSTLLNWISLLNSLLNINTDYWIRIWIFCLISLNIEYAIINITIYIYINWVFNNDVNYYINYFRFICYIHYITNNTCNKSFQIDINILWKVNNT